MSSSRLLVATVLPLILMGLLALPVAYAQSGSIMPRTWNVLVGGQSDGRAVQADAYYPHVITIDVGDKVVWTLNADEPHSVTFFGTCQDFTTLSCFQPSLIPCLTSGALDYVPCSLSSYDGIGLASSGRMIPPGYNWDNSVAHGNATYSLIFTNPGADIYFDVSALGMRGIVIVNPAGTAYPFNQEQYSQQAKQELKSDLMAGAQTLELFQSPASTMGPGNTQILHITAGLSAPQIAKAILKSSADSRIRGTASLSGTVQGPAENITVKVNLSGLVPGSVHSVRILLGVCGAEAPSATLLALPTFVLNDLTARLDGRGSSTTVISSPPSANGPAVLRIPSAGWFISVGTGSGLDTSLAACGNVVFHNASVMRFLPGKLRVNVGDTIVWTDGPNGVHSVTFLAGHSLPLIPDYVFTSPTGNATSYDGSSFFDSGTMRPGDSFVLTLTKPGVYSYVDVFLSFLGMQGSIIVHADSPDE